MAYRSVFGGLLGAFFYWLFAVFPARSPLDRGAPWLKCVLLGVGLASGVSGIPEGTPQLPAAVGGWLGAEVARGLGAVYVYGTIVLGLVSRSGTRGGPQRSTHGAGSR